MSRTERTRANAAPRIRWQFDADVPTSDILDEIDLATDGGLYEAVEYFTDGMEHHTFHAWEGVICQEQGIPLTAEQEQAANGLFSFGPADDEDPSLEPRVLYINELPRPPVPWYETLRKIAASLLLDPFDVTARRSDAYCHSWNELEACLTEHASGLSLPEGVASPVEVIDAELRHRLRLQYSFFALPASGYQDLSLEDTDSSIRWFVDDLQASREAVEYFDLTLDSLLTMVKLPDDERPHFVRLMKEQLSLKSTNERLARHLFGDSWQPDASATTDTNRGEGGGATQVETRSPLRLPAESVKQAILHPDLDTREMAVHYFSESYTSDLSIMPLVIESLARYGKDEAYRLVGAAVDLPQTDATIDWLIGELNQDRSKSYENYTFNLQRVLCAADPRLLQARERDIASAAYLEPGAYEIIAERIGMLAWDADRCWRELEEHCDNHQCCDARDAELGRAGAMVEALARHPVSQERVLDYLAQRVDPHVDSPMKWLEPMMVRLAGLWRLESAIPLLVEKSRSEDDFLHTECEAALIRMSSDAAVRAVADAFAEAEWGFRLAAARVLENTHTDLAVQATLQLIPHEADETISRNLRLSLLGQFSFAAIEPARQWLLEHGFRDTEDQALRNDLLRICEVLGQSLPEFEQWSGDREAEQRERLRMLEESKDNPMGTVLYALEQMTGKKSGEVLKEIEEREASRGEETLIPRPAHSAPRRIGRNDPCPCGSGKKYKKCCLRK